ncbi:hypothetical protein E4K67_14925 [Desulfosporosinus fructosivorans]|uniref:Uncharacterized protein n=1 Tax=Desulfosporosinus fructosivorans TaxID=2018669 RepID=A0A4Z0R316_9FIRM|nr:hypothetical protein [Desulfosporosinus fructosivorans]TGE37170.1 hypothetical protein E4K67_14925 [Desulfosporosinus fructosivorans]
MKRNLSTLTQFDPERYIAIKPIELLHRIGVITTPAIPNLADISSTWAVIRYIWAFEVSTATSIEPLRLSSEARNIDFHQKGLLSDEIGVGMAAYVMANYMNAPNAIDVEIALRTPAWMAIQHYATSPDYLFYDDINGDVFIVECKGNQTSRNSTYEQLRRGTEQVPSIKFSSGRQATSIIIGTCMLPNNTEVYIIDPPGEKGDGSGFLEPGGKTKKIGSTTWEVIDDEKFVRDINSFDRAKKLSYAGAEAEVIKQLNMELPKNVSRFVNYDPLIEIEENELGDFQGVRYSLPTADGVGVEVFKGLLREVANSFIEKEDYKVNEHLVDFRRKLQIEKSHKQNLNLESNTFSMEKDNSTVINSIGTDGTILQVKVVQQKTRG